MFKTAFRVGYANSAVSFSLTGFFSNSSCSAAIWGETVRELSAGEASSARSPGRYTARRRWRSKAPPLISQCSCANAEQALQEGRPFLVGGRLTTADMLLIARLTWAVSYRVPFTPACQAYMARITSRPAYRTALAPNTPSTA